MALETILDLVLFILPAYFANATPVIFGGGTPMDFKRNFCDGRRLLGDGKTWRGFFSGILAGSAVGFVVSWAVPWFPFFAGFLLSFGALFGDTAGSFIKRRMGIGRSKPSLALDQLTFLFFALLFAYPVMPAFLDAYGIAFLFSLTYVMHVLANVLAHRVGWKKVPW
jgi:CDP-2,3-bis-(O-geranylgeranyl)-sn-glycerol synthase